MKKTITILWVLLVSVGMIFPNLYGSIFDTVKFGAISYPTSLDSLENPTPTQSVATAKSHSQQHSDANDAIEAVQAKLGISASTAVTGSILAGNGAGSSIWTTYGTTTNFNATGLGLFGSLISQASSTIVGGLTITGNSTSTNATSTIGAFTNFATSTRYFGAGLSSCIGSNKLLWTGGFFSCAPDSTGSQTANIYTATTSQSNNNLYSASVSMTAGDVLKIWAARTVTCNLDTSILQVRPTTWSASTTIYSAVCSGNNNGTSISLIGTWTATTTYDVVVGQESSNGRADNWGSLIVELVDF